MNPEQSPPAPAPLRLREFPGLSPYLPVYQAMRLYTAERGPADPDQVWLVQHEPVYTLGLGGKTEHLLNPGDIPVHRVDRGGQVTYHGPGQLLVYLLLDLGPLGWRVRPLVHALEQALLDFLAAHAIPAQRREGAPGVYVDGRKIASLGLRVSRGRTYHGLSLNVDMDLEPFSRVNPCGYPGLEMTRLRDYGVELGVFQSGHALLPHLLRHLRLEPVREGV